MPRVSVCIPSYNLAAFVGEAIESVLNQTFADFELLIEDDGSTDESVAAIRAFADARITLVAKPQNEGQNRTTNNLVARATGDYIALLAADDVWEREKLALQVAYLDAHPDCGIAFGLPRFMDARGAAQKYETPGIEDIENAPRAEWQRRFKTGNYLFVSTSLYRRALHEELGKFAEDLPLLADLDWYMRVVKNHDLHVVQQPLARIRQRDGMANLSAPTAAHLEQHADEMEMLLERRYPVDRSKRKIWIATPFYEVKGYAPYIRSLVQTVVALERVGIAFEWSSRMGDSYVWRARNAMAQEFLDSDATELFFIDSDQGWSLESFMRVLKADVDIVGGAYPVKNNWEMYGVTFHTDAEHRPVVDEKTGLIDGQKVPTGFMKIKRRVFELLRRAKPDDWYWEGERKMFNYFGHITRDHVTYGEDISFNIRWQDIGGRVWIEPRCDISHLGVKTWNGNLHEFLLRQDGGSESKNPMPPLKLVA